MYTHIQTLFHTSLLPKVYSLDSKVYKYTLVNASQNTFSIPRKHWISNPGVLCSNPPGASKVDSVFHPSEVEVPGISGNWVVKSKLPPWSDTSLEAVEIHPLKGAIKFFLFFFSYVNSSMYIAFKLSSKMKQNSMFCYSSLLVFWYLDWIRWNSFNWKLSNSTKMKDK